MPEERRRRSGEPEYEDTAEQSFIRKASKNQWVDAAIRIAIVIATAGGTGYMANEHKNTADAAAYDRLTQLQADYEKFTKRYYEREKERRERAEAEHLALAQRLAAAEAEIRILLARSR